MPAHNERRHVLHVVLSMAVGGLETVVKRLVLGLDSQRFRASICCLDERGALADELESCGVEVFLEQRMPGLDLSLPFRLARQMRRRNIDIVHMHNDEAFFYGTLAGKLARVRPLIYTEHGRPIPGSRKKTLTHRGMARLHVQTVPVSAALQRELIEIEGFRPKQLTVIPNGVPDPVRPNAAILRELRARLGAGDQETLLGTVGRLAEVKDHVGLIRAMADLFRIQPRVRLAIVGGGALQSALEQEIVRLGLQRIITLVGEQRDVAPYHHAFDIFVLSSKNEGMPLSLLEAMAAGKPSVAMNVGGVPEVMTDGEHGFLIRPGDYGMFNARLEQLMVDRALLLKCGNNARRSYLARFTVERMNQAYAGLYERSLLKSARRGGEGGPYRAARALRLNKIQLSHR